MVKNQLFYKKIVEKICTYQKKAVPLHRQTNKNNNSKTIKTMTKEELAQKIAQGEYTNCIRDGKFSISFKIGDKRASVSKIGNNFVAMTVISTCISDEDYNKMLKQALRDELEIVKAQEKELTESINEL